MIASIHQPSTSTFNLFDKLLLLSRGKTCYFGPVAGIQLYFDRIGFPVPLHENPAEFLLDVTNVDFSHDQEVSQSRLQTIQSIWTTSTEAQQVNSAIKEAGSSAEKHDITRPSRSTTATLLVPVTLLHRSFVKSYRDVMVYGIRVLMYLGKSMNTEQQV